MILHLLDKFTECLDWCKNLDANRCESTFEDLNVIHEARNVCTEWRELVNALIQPELIVEHCSRCNLAFLIVSMAP